MYTKTKNTVIWVLYYGNSLTIMIQLEQLRCTQLQVQCCKLQKHANIFTVNRCITDDRDTNAVTRPHRKSKHNTIHATILRLYFVRLSMEICTYPFQRLQRQVYFTTMGLGVNVAYIRVFPHVVNWYLPGLCIPIVLICQLLFFI